MVHHPAVQHRPQLVSLAGFRPLHSCFKGSYVSQRTATRDAAWQRQRERQPLAAPHASLQQLSQELLSAALQPAPGLAPALAVNTTVFVLGIRVLLAGLLPSAVALSWVLGTTVYAAFGLGGYVLVCLYFIFGSAGSVWGSGLAGIICAGVALAQGDAAHLWQVAFVASFVSKLSDTVSSEIGKAYGKTTFLITNLSKVLRGTEGAISLEGTLAGVGAAFGFSAVALALGQVTVQGAGIATAAAVLANLFESYLGAASQGRLEWLSNDAINMIQICFAAGVALALQQL